MTPGGGQANVDPRTNIRIHFTEPVQPLTVGSLLGGGPSFASSTVQVEFGPMTSAAAMPFEVRPVSVLDLSTFELVPLFHFPGEGRRASRATRSTVWS